MKIQLLLLISALIVTSCRKTETEKNSENYWKSTKEFSPMSFIRESKKENQFNFTTIENDFPKDWVKIEQLDSLFSIIDSKEKCNCYLNPLSSTIPQDNAEVGGFAIEFIKAFKEKRKIDLGLYSCPKTNEKEAEELKSWWKNYNGK